MLTLLQFLMAGLLFSLGGAFYNASLSSIF